MHVMGTGIAIELVDTKSNNYKHIKKAEEI